MTQFLSDAVCAFDAGVHCDANDVFRVFDVVSPLAEVPHCVYFHNSFPTGRTMVPRSLVAADLSQLVVAAVLACKLMAWKA